jgi:lipid II:glycine glycyltransferase (peptidoglycan interpeptide bridge formation enzyme)
MLSHLCLFVKGYLFCQRVYTGDMEIRFATDTEIENWNQKVLANPDGGNVFQGVEFAAQKQLSGWTPRYVMAGNVALTILEKSVMGLGKLWYLPKGPGVKTIVGLGNMLSELKQFAHANGVFVVKVEPELTKTDDALKAARELDLVKVTPIQPNYSTVLIDLSPDLDAIMANLNQKGRHAIRRAERDGVTVERADRTDENYRTFYDLLTKTADGQGFSSSIRPYEYYKAFWERYTAAGYGQLFLARFNDEVVAGAFAMVYGEKSTYKDGASVRVDGAYGITHLVQWNVIQWAKESGSKVHDLCGTPPSDQINDESHRWYGVGRFKTSFNKQVTDYIGAYDIVVHPRQYKWWTQFGERITKSIWWRTHHESWY